MTKEVMKQALKALETAWYHVGTFAPTDDAIELYDKARTSLRQAIAEVEKQEQGEPVCDKDPRGCWSIRCQLGKKCKNTPQTKEWVGLNGADWNDFNPLKSNDPHRVADWVEKILKERNT